MALWPLPAGVLAVAVTVAAVLVPADARAAVIGCGAGATAAVLLVALEAARRGQALAALRTESADREAALVRHLQHQESTTVRLAEELIPRAVARLQEGEFAEDVLLSTVVEGEGLSPEFRAAHQALLRSVVEAVEAEESMRDSAQRGVVNIARRVQAIVHQQATDLRAMEERHGSEPDFFADLLRLDHGTALIGRLADSIAVLGGARPGRMWSKAVPLYSVLRGAMSRILDYQRVELHSVPDVAVTGPAVEPLIHALAELLDNATRYSPPKARVHLTAGEVHMGIAIEIEDGGVGLSEEARERAERMLRDARGGIDLNDLGEAPRLGLAVVGRVAQAYNLQVSLPPSAYGGVRAVLCVPKDLITTAPATGKAHGIGASSGPRPTPRADSAQTASRDSGDRAIPGPRSAPDAAAGPADGDGPARAFDEQTGSNGGQETAPAVTERTPSGLPQRRRKSAASGGRTSGRGGFAAAKAPLPGPAETAHEEPAPGVWMTEFQSGLSGEPPKPMPAAGTSDTTDRGE